MKSFLLKLGARLKAIRKARGLTQESLAEKADLTPQYLSRLESGQQSPSLEAVARLAEALELEVWELFDFEHEGTIKDVRARLRRLIHEADEPQARLALRLFQALFR